MRFWYYHDNYIKISNNIIKLLLIDLLYAVSLWYFDIIMIFWYIKILNYLWDFKNLRSWYYHHTISILSNDCWYIFRMPFRSDILILFNDILIYQNIRLIVRFCWYYHDIWYKNHNHHKCVLLLPAEGGKKHYLHA